MVALALFFIMIIGLLWLLVKILQKFFETYKNRFDDSCFFSDFENCRRQQDALMPLQEINKDINAVISKRLLDLEAQFPIEQTQKENPEAVILAFKNMLQSSLNLLKEATYNEPH